MIKKQLEREPTEGELKAFMAQVDVDQDGRLSLKVSEQPPLDCDSEPYM